MQTSNHFAAQSSSGTTYTSVTKIEIGPFIEIFHHSKKIQLRAGIGDSPDATSRAVYPRRPRRGQPINKLRRLRCYQTKSTPQMLVL